MKPTISIYKDEIVIATDNFDLILKTGAERKAQSEEREPEPLTDEERDWKFNPFDPYFSDLRKEIEDDMDKHPEKFEKPKIKYTDQRVVNVPVEKAVVYTPAEIAPITTPNPSKLEGNGKHTRNLPAKPCIQCGNDFKPTWNTQRYCPNCKHLSAHGKRKPLAEQTTEELEKTLKDIENRRKKTYEFK